MRSFGIDIIRTIGIIMVVFRHYNIYTKFNWGYYAVEALFIVSGYLIGQMLFNSYFETPKVQPYALKKFIVRRWLRVFPLYYFLLIVKFILAPAIGLNIIYYFLFLQNNFYGITFYPVTWTLCIEEWFYIVTPFLIYGFLRFVSQKPAHLTVFLLSIILFIVIARSVFVHITDRPFGGLTGNVPLRLDSPLMGVFLAWIKFNYKNIFNKMNTLWFFLCGIGAISLFTVALYWVRSPIDRIDDFFWTRTVLYNFLGITTMMVLPYMEKSVKVPEGKLWGILAFIMKWAGKLSFAIYLTHTEVMRYMQSFLSNHLPQPLIIFLAIIATTTISFVLHQLIEKKALEWRDRRHPDNWQTKM